ncbi:MAG TPA: AarF/UbiB family protein [Lapillicoccus sp.]
MNELAVVVAALINALILGFISRRLLGVPVGWPRTILVSLLVSWIFGRIAELISRIPGVDAAIQTEGSSITAELNTLQALLLLMLGLAWAVAFGLAILVVLEAIVPTGSLPRLVPWLRGIPARWRRSRRYAQIVAIATKHGLGGYLRGRAHVPAGESDSTVARSLRGALADGGVTFVKLGQMLATRPDLIGPDFARELSRLQSDVPASPWPRVAAAVEVELGRPLSEVFSSVDKEPLAAASVAQVHTATLHDGTSVVLKVQRPEARAQVTADLDIVLRLAAWLQRSTAWGRRLGIRSLAEGFAASLDEELDYTVELANHAAVAADLDPRDGVVVPHAYRELSTPRLIVMERMSGTPVSRAALLLGSLDPTLRSDMAHRLLRTVLRQVMVTGVFHADLHQGNVLVDESGRLALLDLGAVGRLDSGSRNALALLLHGVERRDSVAATEAMLDLLDRPEDLDDRAFERELGQLLQRFAGSAAGGSSGMFSGLFTLVIRHHFAVPPQVAAALRALGALEGTLWSLSPEVDLVAAARQEGRAVLAGRFGPQEVRAALEDQLVTLLPLLHRLPRRLGAITEGFERGRSIISVRILADERDRSFVTGVVQQLTLTLLAAACALGGIVLITADTGPFMLPTLRLYAFLGATLFFFGFVLAARALVLVFRRSAPT